MIESLNRAFLYGESVFTTMRMVGDTLHDWDHHFERLKKGVEYVFGPFSDGEAWVALLKNRLQSSVMNETGDKVIRLTVYRHQSRGLRRMGLTSVSDLKIHLHADTYHGPVSGEGSSVQLRSCSLPMRPHWWPEYLKAGSYLDVILAQKKFLQPGDDDLLFLSPEGTVLESSVANVFFVREGRLSTAPAGPNVLDGVMRKKILGAAGEFFRGVDKEAIRLLDAYEADAAFACNSVKGPFLVKAIDGREIRPRAEFLKKFESLKEKVMR